MKDEAILWFKSSTEKDARKLLLKKYRRGLVISLVTLGIGIILSFIAIHYALNEIPMYLTIFSVMYMIYAWSQIRILKKMD